jgi:hypothetical protein
MDRSERLLGVRHEGIEASAERVPLAALEQLRVDPHRGLGVGVADLRHHPSTSPADASKQIEELRDDRRDRRSRTRLGYIPRSVLEFEFAFVVLCAVPAAARGASRFRRSRRRGGRWRRAPTANLMPRPETLAILSARSR